MRSLAFLLATAVVAAPAPANPGPAVTLNGVNIGGVVNQRFENVTVVIDAQGNLDIQAKGYVARVASAPAPAALPIAALPIAAAPAAAAPSAGVPVAAVAASTPAASTLPAPPPAAATNGLVASASATPARLARRYFLATEQSQPDATQYDVEVFINASWIRVVKSTDPQVVIEITRFLRPGPNKVTLSCTKKAPGGERRGGSPESTLRVVIGAGNVGGDQVMIDESLAVMTRTAAEVEDKVEEYVVEAR